MASSIQKCLQSTHRKTLKCCVAALCLDPVPSQLQQRLVSSRSHRSGSSHRVLIVPRWPSEEHLLRWNGFRRLRDGNEGLLTTTQSFSVTNLPSGSRFFSSDSSVSSSSSSTFEALGDVDELNSALGLAHAYCSQAQLTSTLKQIEEIQSRLLDIGSAVAIPLSNPFSKSSKKVPRVKFNAATVEVLESWRATMDKEVPHQTGFILPSGGLPATSLHVARSICRRAERKMITLVEEEVVDESVVRYLNGLSDYLFTAARHAASKLGTSETSWSKNQRR